jgi:hypothetical protein
LVLSYEAMANDVDARQIVEKILSIIWAPELTPGPLAVSEPYTNVKSSSS